MSMTEGTTFQHQFLVTRKIYEGFLEIFNDRNPMHTDKNFAQSKGYNDVILHGNILGGFLSYFIGECLPQKNVMIIGQNINYHKPFFIDDQLDFSATIKYLSEATGVVDFKYVFRNQTKVKIAKGNIQIKLL